MKKYIPTLMEMYQEMIKENEVYETRKKKFLKDNPGKRSWDFHGTPEYSDTMLHYIITIINKLNNK